MKSTLYCLLNQLPGARPQQLRQWIGNRVSTCQLNNVILAHSGVSFLVVCLSRDNKSTRYAVFFDCSNTRFSDNSHLNVKIEIDRDAIHVYCCRYDRIDEPRLLDHYHSLLDQAELQRWQGIRTGEGKQSFLVSRAMIRTLLGTAIGCSPTALTVTTDARGKPYIDRPTTRWQFNLSHSHGLITLALAYDTAVGIDVEYHHRNIETLQLARHFFHPREIRQLEAIPTAEQQHHFFKLWTLKEAYVKADGRGLSQALDSFGFTLHRPGPRLAFHHHTKLPMSCWLIQPEPGYTLACIALAAVAKSRRLKLNDCLPHHHCIPRQPHSLVNGIIAPSPRNRMLKGVAFPDVAGSIGEGVTGAL